jgi:hypothetical protein
VDKYSTYVIIVYALTFIILAGYLAFIALRLRQEDRE